MKSQSILLWAFLALVFTLNSYAQRNNYWKGSGGWGRGDHYVKIYDPKTVITIHGSVIKEEAFAPFKGMGTGFMILVKTTDGEMKIHVGPMWFVENQDIDIDIGDVLEITGSKVQFDGQTVIIARSITKEENTFLLRDENGLPVWSTWYRQKLN